jgi:hypothetical protein
MIDGRGQKNGRLTHSRSLGGLGGVSTMHFSFDRRSRMKEEDYRLGAPHNAEAHQAIVMSLGALIPDVAYLATLETTLSRVAVSGGGSRPIGGAAGWGPISNLLACTINRAVRKCCKCSIKTINDTAGAQALG